MSTVITNKKGKQITLLNPSEKGKKCAVELKTNIHITNDGVAKTDDYGDFIPLTDAERAYRAGYLAAQKDSAKCYNAQQKKKNSKLPALVGGKGLCPIKK